MSQLPPVLESLTGVKLEKLLEKIPALKESSPSPRSEES
jgi:flotillin